MQLSKVSLEKIVQVGWESYFSDIVVQAKQNTAECSSIQLPVTPLPVTPPSLPAIPVDDISLVQTYYIPAIRRPQTTDPIPVLPHVHTDAHNLSTIALRIALPESINHLLQYYLDEREQVPIRIRSNAILGLRLIEARLIWQGHLRFKSVLIPFYSDTSLAVDTIYIDY